jgi:hypothetical protein
MINFSYLVCSVGYETNELNRFYQFSRTKMHITREMPKANPAEIL